MEQYVISREDTRSIQKALDMCAIDDEAAALVLEALIIKKDAEIAKLKRENGFLRDKLFELEQGEVKVGGSDAD